MTDAEIKILTHVFNYFCITGGYTEKEVSEKIKWIVTHPVAHTAGMENITPEELTLFSKNYSKGINLTYITVFGQGVRDDIGSYCDATKKNQILSAEYPDLHECTINHPHH